MKCKLQKEQRKHGRARATSSTACEMPPQSCIRPWLIASAFEAKTTQLKNQEQVCMENIDYSTLENQMPSQWVTWH